MDARKSIIGLALAAALSAAMTASPALADEAKSASPPGGGWHGMMGGYGGGYGMMGPGMMMGGPGMGMMDGWGPGGFWVAGPDLGLSEAQQKKLDALAAEARAAGQADWKAMTEAHQKMHAAMSGDKVDRAAALAAFRQMNDIMARQMERSLDFREKAEAVLTDKQRATLREWQRGAWGCGGAPGAGPGPGRMMDKR